MVATSSKHNDGAQGWDLAKFSVDGDGGTQYVRVTHFNADIDLKACLL